VSVGSAEDQPPGSELTLRPGSALVANASVWPQVSMRDLPTGQEACRSAVASLDYRAMATP
jgi:hypothetical protein